MSNSRIRIYFLEDNMEYLNTLKAENNEKLTSVINKIITEARLRHSVEQGNNNEDNNK